MPGWQTGSMELTVTDVEPGSQPYRDCLALREAVMRAPLGLPILPEDLALDEESFHLAALINDKVAGTVALKPLGGGRVKLRQMAVHPECQRAGIGSCLVESAEELARMEGFTAIELHARMTALGFYEKMGYAAQGKQFTEHGIPHVKMMKRL